MIKINGLGGGHIKMILHHSQPIISTNCVLICISSITLITNHCSIGAACYLGSFHQQCKIL